MDDIGATTQPKAKRSRPHGSPARAGERADAQRRGIQSMETGLHLLASLAACGGPVPLSAVAQRAGVSPSQAHRYLSSLMAAGMAKQDPGTGFYDLDAGAIRLGLAALARIDVFARADVTFMDFARATGRTCLLAVWGDAGATVVRWYPGTPPVITSLAIGSVMPLLRSATGRVFLAFGDREAMDAEARRAREADRADAPIDLEAIRREVRAAGGAQVDNTLIPGLRAAAAPVFDLQGRLAVVATAMASSAFDPTGDAAAVAALHAACRDVTEAIGGRWPGAVSAGSEGRTPQAQPRP
ncbi:IclR family transcriptional regulator [Methylobacterium nodulans]|uniref:Transcriptional regulator, IclR family n=1 Tax=Methylobacterium nodulans (strain LMG 21967 / CNCM I-2342 / ORS 2060) TaxID=460265 RepID=B8IPX2_METNO|nr:IclR family transcriptional regulator [Methylobacterium nodulans]ACL56622.1 transcriptional regulator, IclR family [Methylobacterium nodulans ORS 2060]